MRVWTWKWLIHLNFKYLIKLIVFNSSNEVYRMLYPRNKNPWRTQDFLVHFTWVTRQYPLIIQVLLIGKCRRFDHGFRTEFLHSKNLSLFHEMNTGFLHEKIIFLPSTSINFFLNWGKGYIIDFWYTNIL